MKLSYVIISHGRKDTLLPTLYLLNSRTPLPRDQWEVWVIDNGSMDGTADAVCAAFPQVHLIRLPHNQGMPARNHGFDRCRGDYIITLDDDSYPKDASAVRRMLNYLDNHPETGALVARVELHDGSAEAPALPAIAMGGATCFRRSVLNQIGGYGREFFRQAEEYDLSCRMWAAGYRIERFEDIIFKHEKVSGPGRRPALVDRMDLRNNLIVAERYLPLPLRTIYRDDWTLRYGVIARQHGHRTMAMLARLEGAAWALHESRTGRQPLPPAAIESIFDLDRQADQIGQWAKRRHIRRVCIADFGKNLYATYRACGNAWLDVEAILDSAPAFAGMSYRHVPILPLSPAALAGADGVVISNINPAQVDARESEVRRHFDGPVLRLWEPKVLGESITAARAAA